LYSGGSKRLKKIIIGKFASTHGLKGHIKVISCTNPESNIVAYKDLYILKDDDFELLDIESFKMLTHTKALLKLTSYDSIDSVSHLVNNDIYIARSALPNLNDDNYYWSDLVGLRVKTIAGDEIGQIDHLFETGSNDVILIKDKSGKDILIPYLKNVVVVEVDLSKSCMIVDWDLSGS
jgi:16S rRNA processing protein RimM